jgi:hypothetical protein
VTDPYAHARRVATTLRVQNLQGWAQRIEDIIDGGSTSTEILMGLRWVMAEILRLAPLEPATRQTIEVLSATLHNLLRQ